MARNRGYRFIFWGFMLTILHINLGNTEVLPNFIALIIIARGIHIVLGDNQNKELQQALQWCKIYIGVQAIAFLIELLQNEMFYINLGSIFNDTLTIILFAADTILTIMVIFYLFIGSEIVLDEAGKNYSVMDLEPGETFMPVRNLSKSVTKFVVMYSIGTLSMMPVLIFGNDFGIIAVIGALIVFAESIWVASNIAYIRRQYPDYR